jgi:hypothetical protein
MPKTDHLFLGTPIVVGHALHCITKHTYHDADPPIRHMRSVAR